MFGIALTRFAMLPPAIRNGSPPPPPPPSPIAAPPGGSRRGLEADVLVTSGGVSMGPHDLVRKGRCRAGCRGGVLGVSVKPGEARSPSEPGEQRSSLVCRATLCRLWRARYSCAAHPLSWLARASCPSIWVSSTVEPRPAAATDPPRRVRAGAPPLGGGRCLRRTGLWPGVAHDLFQPPPPTL